jgi:hypothetical protein
VDFDQILSSTNTVKEWAGSEDASADVALALLLIEKSTKQRKTIISILEKLALRVETPVTVLETDGPTPAASEASFLDGPTEMVVAEDISVPTSEPAPGEAVSFPSGTVVSCFFEKDRQPYLSISFLSEQDQETVGRASLALNLRARRSFVEAAMFLGTPAQGSVTCSVSLDTLLPLILWF